MSGHHKWSEIKHKPQDMSWRGRFRRWRYRKTLDVRVWLGR